MGLPQSLEERGAFFTPVVALPGGRAHRTLGLVSEPLQAAENAPATADQAETCWFSLPPTGPPAQEDFSKSL